jgi:hypothetical protein
MRGLVPFDVPVDPDDEQARRWLEEELGGQNPQPQEGLPQWLQDLLDWLRDLFGGAGPDVPPPNPGDPTGTIAIVILIALLVAGLVVAFVIFGLPRFRRRRTVTGELFGEDDDRSAQQIRTAAQQAADAGDYSSAVIEVFRALARDLAERGVIVAFPGTTAREFGRRASDVFPDTADRLDEAARVFDGVRYLGRAGTEEQWREMSALAAELSKARGVRRNRAADALLSGVES